MARIMIDARCLADSQSGGVARAARIWIMRKKALSPNDTFVCFTTGLHASEIVDKFCSENGLEYFHLKVPNKLWTIGCLLRFWSLASTAQRQAGPIDHVLLPNIGFTGTISTPYTLLVHDLSFLIEPRWFGWRRRLWHKVLPLDSLIAEATKIECVSEQTRKDMLKLFKVNADRTSVIDPMDQGIRNETISRPDRIGEDERFVLLLGGADPRKNVSTALKAVEAFNLENPEDVLKTVIIGGHPHHSIAGQVDIPKVTDQELSYLYSHALALLYPSWYEGFGLPLHEAGAFGTPVISSSSGALSETAPTGIIFCHPAKPHEWKMALTQVIKGTLD